MTNLITQQELYKLVLQHFKARMFLSHPETEMTTIISNVDQEVKFLMTGSRDNIGYVLTGEQHEEIAGIVWDLIVQRIVTFTSQGHPWLRLTEYGKKVAEAEGPVPYDPYGYIEHIKSKAAGTSELALEYIEEAIKCLRGGAYRATAVMLGVASEESFLQLMSSFEKKYAVKIIPDKFKPVQQLREDFKKKFEPHKNDLPIDIKNNIHTTLDGIYDLIKKSRDDSGHPSGINVTRDEVMASFSVLPLYLERIQNMINFYIK